MSLFIAAAIILGFRADVDWPNVGNDRGCMRYSTLDQIDRRNVNTLRPAWTYHAGDAGEGSTIECTPIVIGGIMYVTSVKSKVIALDGATGREIWKYDPYADYKPRIIASGGVNRGVAYWSDGNAGRVLLGAADGRLISLDAKTGKADPGFGKNGSLDLREGIEYDITRFPYGATSAPAIYRDLVILGFSASEGPGPGAPGDIRAFDVRTGKEVWRFHTVPRPGEFGYETWEPDSWKGRSGTNAWGGLSVDEKRGMVFAGLGSANFDFYGGDRKGRNLFANCTIGLEAKTGKRIWHFQTLHHDLWDHDLPVYPNLVTVNHNGRRIDAAAQVTKTGYVFLFDRITGKPLFDVVERSVRPSDLPGEEAWPTQPIPVKPPPFSKVSFGEEDATDISKEARDYVLGKLKTVRSGPAFIPPSFEGTVTIPGFHGGATWSGASSDPTTGILYVNSNNVPNLTTLKKTPDRPYPYDHTGYFRFLDQEGYPAIKPPWGLLTAIDLNRGEFAWQVRLGEFPELTARGIPQTGTENFGGTIVTAGGLVFIGGSKDEKFHAFDKSTGSLLWEYKLPAGGYATPCTYSVNGRQYVCIAAGGGGKLGTASGDSYVAFALPVEGGRRTANHRSPRVEVVSGGSGLNGPFGVDFDRAGNMYVVEMPGNRVRKVDRRGVMTIVAGTGEKADSGDGAPAASANLNGPHSLAVAPNGDVYVADTFNNRIRRIGRSGVIGPFAGTGEKGFEGDGGPAIRAKFGGIYCIAFDRKCERMYLADLDNRRIRVVDMKNGIVNTVAGNGRRGVPEDGADARNSPLVDPRAVAVDSKGNIYILERSGHALRVVDKYGRIRTVVGTGKQGFGGDGGDARLALMNGPKHLCIDGDDTVIIADTENHVIRRYIPAAGRIERVAGTGIKGNGGIGGSAEQVELNQPHGVYVDPKGDLYVSDSANNRVLKIGR